MWELQKLLGKDQAYVLRQMLHAMSFTPGCTSYSTRLASLPSQILPDKAVTASRQTRAALQPLK